MSCQERRYLIYAGSREECDLYCRRKNIKQPIARSCYIGDARFLDGISNVDVYLTGSWYRRHDLVQVMGKLCRGHGVRIHGEVSCA
jgi:hypothetical protein